DDLDADHVVSGACGVPRARGPPSQGGVRAQGGKALGRQKEFAVLSRWYLPICGLGFILCSASVAAALPQQPQAPSGNGRVVVTIALEGVRIPAVSVELRSV